MRKLLIVVLCGFVHRSACSRVRYEQPFHDSVYRQDPHLHGEPVFKREHFFPRDSIEQILPQPIRSEPVYPNERILPPPPPQQPPFSNEDFLQNEQIVHSEPFIRGEPVLRREPFLRREPLFRREPFIRRGRLYQNLRPEPSAYAVMVAQCQCQEPQRVDPPPQEAFFPVPQPIQQQPIVSQLIVPKQTMKQPMYHQFIAFPRIQRIVRKSFKPEGFQFGAPPADFGPFPGEPFQGQGAQPESTSEPSQTKPVTVRTVAQMPNALTLAQMSSIC